MPLTIAQAFARAPHPSHDRHGEVEQHLDATACEQDDDVLSGDSWPYCTHGQRFTHSSECLLAEMLADEGFAA